MVAVLLMVVGIAVISAFTASIASFMFEQGSQDRIATLEQQLEAMNRKLDLLVNDSRRTPVAGAALPATEEVEPQP